MESHINAFHSIKGTTHSELSRNYSTFERSLNDETFDPERFFALLETKTFTEDYLRVKLLRRFSRHEDSLKTLIEGPVMFNKRILSDPKLIQHIANNYSGEDLIREILTQTSFKIRAKLINKLAFCVNDNEKGCDFYKAVLAEYGFKVAKPLLIACSEEVIICAIEEDDVKFTHAELRKCYAKSKTLLQVYFKQHENFCEYEKLARYICIDDMACFHSLTKYGIPILGRKTLHKYFSAYKSDCIKDAEYTRAIFFENFKWRCFNEEEMCVWFGKLLPDKVGYFGWEVPKYLEMLPWSNRGNVLFKAFREKYGFDVWDYKEFDVYSILEVLALGDRRKFDLSEYIHFESTEKAQPVLKKQLRLAKTTKRTEIMRLILLNCKCNNDYVTLLRIMRNFVEYQKNEIKAYRAAFVLKLTEFFSFKKFTAEHWECVDKIILHFHINNEYEYSFNKLNIEYIKYRMSKGLDYELNLKIMFKTVGAQFDFEDYPKYDREIILKFREYMHELTDEDPKYVHINLVNNVSRWNCRNRKNKIACNFISLNDYRDSLKIVTEDYKIQRSSFHDLETLLVSLGREKEDFDDVLETLMSSAFKKGNFFAQHWFLNKKPHLIEKNLHVLFTSNKLHQSFWYALQKLESPMKLKIMQHALEVLQHPSGRESSEICSSLALLALSRDLDLPEITKPWVPLEFKIDAQKEGTKELYEIQKALIKTYKNRYNLIKTIPEILHVCNGDYLKHALEPLYYLSTSIPEMHLISPLETFARRSVSARKHVLLIIAYSSSLHLKHVFLKTFTQTVNNASVKKTILQSLCKILQDDRTESDWNFFTSHLHFIDPQDKDINQLVYAKNIPKKYYTKFITLMWNELNKRGKHEEFKLFGSLNYSKFNFENSGEIIKHSFLNDENEYLTATNKFILYYTLSGDAKTNILFLWACIEENTQALNRYKAQKLLQDFFAYFCQKVVAPDEEDKKLFDETLVLNVIQTMHALLPNLKIHNDYVIKQLLEITVEYKSKTLMESVLRKLKARSQAYAKFVAAFLEMVNDEKLVFDLIEGVCKCDDSVEAKAFCVELLPNMVPQNVILCDKYYELLGRLEDGCEGIGAYVDAYLLNVTF